MVLKDERGGQRGHRRQYVQRKGRAHQRPIADTVSDQAEENDRQTKAPQAAAGNLPEFSLGKPELAAPIVEDAAANREADASSNQSDEAGEE